jgi:osmotically-inducible protein OsmY
MSLSMPSEHLVEHASEQLRQDLASEVELALWSDDRLRSTDSLVSVGAGLSGAVTLEGHVRGDLLKALAGRLAGQVQGVSTVDNRLVADTHVENEVALRLAMDPEVRTLTDDLMVKSLLGVVQLSGVVRGPDQATAEAARHRAERLAREVPGVRDVLNVTRATVGSAAEGATAEDVVAAPAAGGGEEATMAARLAVWKERAAAKAG